MQTVGVLACVLLIACICLYRGYTVGFEKGQSEGIKNMGMVQFAADSELAMQLMKKVEKYKEEFERMEKGGVTCD